MKRDTLHLTFKDGETDKIELESDSLDIIDWKRPAMAVAEDGFGDFSKKPLTTKDD